MVDLITKWSLHEDSLKSATFYGDYMVKLVRR